MTKLRVATAAFGMMMITSVAALGFEPMAATVRIANDGLYDYVNIGENPKATDGYDNAYDTISPGNLNAEMGQPFISATIVHPEYKAALRELRGDIRSPAKKQQWQITVSSSLAKGTPLTVALLSEPGGLPRGLKLTLRDKKKEIDLRTGSYTLPAPGAGTAANLFIIAEQP